MGLTQGRFPARLVVLCIAASLALLNPTGAMAAPSDTESESTALIQCQIQAFLQFQSNASVTYSAIGTDCTSGFVGKLTVRLEGPGVSEDEMLEATCTQRGGCSTASATVPCIDGELYTGLAELFDSAGNSINTGSTFGTCQHCGSTPAISQAGPCEDELRSAART